MEIVVDAFENSVFHHSKAKAFSPVEYFHVREKKVSAVECFFGGKASFPSAVSTGKE
jgi:hypothetical protein